MAEIQPLRALHYDLERVTSLADVIAPPYDVVDPGQRAALLRRSPHNVVALDLPEPTAAEPDRYAHAAGLLQQWTSDGILVRDDVPALWALEQEFTGPDGATRTRRGFFARVRVTDYGPGQIRPHERTHPGPKADRLSLTQATRANLSPIFSLFDDPRQRVAGLLQDTFADAPFGEATDDEGTHNRVWRTTDPEVIAGVQAALAQTELLIADGHHRYETARAYADEIGGEGDHRYVLMQLVAMQDEGLVVHPTHRLVSGLAGDSARQEALAAALREHFDITEIAHADLRPEPGGGPLQLGYIDSHFKRAFRCELKTQAIADAALPGMPDAYRTLDTAVLEALILKGPLGLTEDDISHLNGLGYARTDDEALARVLDGTYDCAFFLRPSPVDQVRAVAATGVNMPPKSTFFYPKVPTGLLLSPLA
ncbi:MAG: hypothetical protein JWN65_1118 [Solirubrobacterales bacterium]|nr:hypothetical protein [Solirubrobacterales bacterium]